MHDIGFKYKTRNGIRYVMEDSDIVIKRLNYLRKYKLNMDSKNPKKVIFQDETWTYRNGTGKRKDWQDSSRNSCSLRKVSQGPRYLICHAGGKDGFVENASLIMCTEKKPKVQDDYHGDMTSKIFLNWFAKMLKNLKEPSLIIIDNASYHSTLVRYVDRLYF